MSSTGSLEAQPGKAAGRVAAEARRDGPPAAGAGEGPQHEKGLLTLVSSSSSGGVEVQDSGSGSWQPLVLGPDQLLVMVGYSLTVATAGALPTCMHRVSGRDGSGTWIVCGGSMYLIIAVML
jgi:isopenicillin N synthase-like dioxygenase